MTTLWELPPQAKPLSPPEARLRNRVSPGTAARWPGGEGRGVKEGWLRGGRRDELGVENQRAPQAVACGAAGTPRVTAVRQWRSLAPRGRRGSCWGQRGRPAPSWW